jgi:pilus assembly protein CpaC
MTQSERRWLSLWSLVVIAALATAPTTRAMQAAAEAGAMMPKKAPTGLGKAVSGAQQGAAEALGSVAPGAVTPGAPAAAEAAGEAGMPQEGFPEGSVPLRVLAGKSILVNTTDRLKRVAVSDPSIADALVVTPTQILVHGRQPGEVSLVLWDEAERSRSFDLRVDVDATSAAEEIHRIFPSERIDVSASRNAIVLSGHVSSEEIQKHAGMLAGAYSKAVVNVLTFGPYEPQEVLLQVKFAEVNRDALERYAVNLFSTNVSLIGQTGTGNRPPVALDDADVKDVPEGAFSSNLNINPLNIFLFRPDVHVGAAIQALKQKSLAQILAEPNLIALNGKEASFLAGGEFPIPIVQGGGNVGNVTVQFKEFGVRLKFTPYIMPTGNIRLKVAPEVSQLDFANGVTLSGFTIPALITRRAETELELQDGQSFLIAGLIDNRVANVAQKIPGLGDIPIIGYLFRSKFNQKTTGELMVLVTARKVSPSVDLPPGPQFPQEFLDKQKFDKSKPKEGGK